MESLLKVVLVIVGLYFLLMIVLGTAWYKSAVSSMPSPNSLIPASGGNWFPNSASSSSTPSSAMGLAGSDTYSDFTT